jgi:hypothetical protein
LNYIVRDVVPRMPKGYRYTLLDIGLVINQLMGHGYCSNYARRKFRSEYCASQEKFASQFPAKTNTVVSFEPNGQVKIPFFLLYTYIVQCVIINKSEDKKTVRNREEESAVDY